MKQILTLLFVQLYMYTITKKMISYYIFYLKSRCSPYMHAADAHKNENTFSPVFISALRLIQYPPTVLTLTCMNSNLPGH